MAHYAEGDVYLDLPGSSEEKEVTCDTGMATAAALFRIHAGQTRVLGMLAEGLLNKQIAYELGVSEATIKAHVSAVLHKLGVDSRTQAVIMLSRIGADPLQAAG